MESHISKQPEWFLYVLLCADGTYYTGITTDVERRLHEHNTRCCGAKYTRTRRPVKLMRSASYDNRSTVQKAEYNFKKLTRKQKDRIVKNEAEWWNWHTQQT